MTELAQQPEQEHLLAPLNTTLAAINPVMQRLTMLRDQEIAAKQPVSIETARLARSADSALKALAKTIPGSELAKKKVEARGIYQWFAKLLDRYIKRVGSDREYCSRIMQEWDREQGALAEARAREHTDALREFAAAQNLDMPIVAPYTAPPAKLDGVSIRSYYTVAEIVDPIIFMAYLMANPHHLSGVKMEINLNYWKRFLNNRAGTETPEIPGLEIVQDGSTTNRRNI